MVYFLSYMTCNNVLSNYLISLVEGGGGEVGQGVRADAELREVLNLRSY